MSITEVSNKWLASIVPKREDFYKTNIKTSSIERREARQGLTG